MNLALFLNQDGPLFKLIFPFLSHPGDWLSLPLLRKSPANFKNDLLAFDIHYLL